MNLKQFKEEFRLICTDTWGDAMDAWFECAGRLYKRRQTLPDNWEYKPPAIGSPCDKESHFHYLMNDSSTLQLTEIGNFLFRYCQYLKYKGVDY